MKRFIVLFVLLLNINSTNAHKEWVHKHIIIQAFEFLKIYYPNITNTDFNLFLGSNYSAGCDGVAYNYGTLTAGAWREDCEDPVFLRHGLLNQRTSITHFWDADQGDNSMIQLCDPECWSYANAYQKALIYKNGGWELNIQIIIYGFPTNSNGSGGCATQWAIVTFRYDGLRDIYVNNNLYVTKVKWNSGETTIYNNPIKFTSSHWSSLNEGSYILFLKKIVFETIGRISHLLQDMSVPAHVNNDRHPCILRDPDAYELFIAGNDWTPIICDETKTTFPAQNYTATTALAQGGFIHLNGMNFNEIIRYLFYTQNQLSDHFPSGRPNTSGYTNKFILGNNDLPNGSNPYLMERYSILGSPPNSFDYHQIASETLNFSIRANAALLYWFAVELEIIPNTLINNSFNGGNIWVDGSNYSSGHRLPSWNNPSSVNLQAIDQVYDNCYWRFQNWQKIQNGIVVQTLNTRNITIIPTANTTYKANFTSENSFNFFVTGPTKGLYHGESRVFTINPQYGNPSANFSWQTKFRYIVNGQVFWSDLFPEGCSINFYTNGGNSATLTNYHFSTYCSGWADSVMRVYGIVQPSNCGSPGQQFFEEITLKNRERSGSPPPPPPGGCPYIYTWNGNDWIEDNNILPQSQDPNLIGQYVTDYYQLYTKPAEEDGKYYLAIGEYEEDISYLDQVKLLVIDHPLETFITIDDSGSVIQFAKPAFFADATLDSADVYKLLYSLDSIKTEVSPSDTLSLSFEDVNAGTEQWLLLVGQVQAVAKAKVSGRIVSDTDDGKENSYSFTSFRLRRNPTYQWIVAPTSNTSSLQVDIVWQEEAEVDYAELSNRLELPFTLCEAELLFAVHSTNGDITTELVADDELVSELNQDEWIELVFSIPEKTVDMQRSFIFVSKGRYERLSQKLNKPSSKEEEVILPSETKLYSNYPNPFNPSTMICYSLREEGNVSIKVYDILGSEVATLVNETKPAGTYEVEFNASQLPSGVYIYRMSVGSTGQSTSYISSKKMMLIK